MKPLSFPAFLTQYYYTEGLMVTTGIIALIISIKYFRRHRELRIFAFYLLFSLIQIGTDLFRYMRPGQRSPQIIEVLTTIAFMLFENIVCILFIYKRLISRTRKRIVVWFPGLFFVGFLLMMKLRNESGVFTFFLVDCIAQTIPCFIYFYEQFVYPSDKALKTQPAFWVITGMLFLNCLSIPLYLLSGLKSDDLRQASSLNFFLYAVLYCMLVRAFLCRPAIEVNETATAAVRLAGQPNVKPIQ